MTTPSDPLTFQILGSAAKDVDGAFCITLFGATATGQSVSCEVTGFEPFFYIELPEAWISTEQGAYKRYIQQSLTDEEKTAISFDLERHRSFWDFSDNRQFPFLKIQTRSKKLWMKVRDICQDKETCLPIPVPLSAIRLNAKGSQTLRVFEANIDPVLRFFHMRELKPAGWATVPADLWDEADEAHTTALIQATTEWTQITPATDDIQLSAAPLKIMSWDIECTSSHGDFPLAIKTWRKPAREIVAADLTEWSDVEAEITAAVAGTSSHLSQIYLGGSSDVVQRELALGFRKLESTWPALPSFSAEDIIDRVDELLSRHLPPPEGDPIIQIGSVVYVNGRAIRKDIFVLGSCVRLKDQGAPTHTHSCANEAALIRAWCKLIGEIDPDIMVGYNIFGFDDKYLWDRAAVNRCTQALRAFSRVTDKSPRLQEKQLSSSAMGDNLFYVITGEGRLHIDLLAYVRRNATLDSYSLDNVTATYMSGGVGSVTPGSEPDTWTIKTKSTKGTTIGRFIVLMDEENDVIGDKLEVVAVEPKALHVHAPGLAAALADHGPPPVRWSQAKDDVSPKDIFALHRGGPADRSRVARYCIQDCDLVMELFQKLEVLNNSIAMANVCWVPVEYIFTRGQGIKSESLVFYECRKEDQLIPVLPAPPRPQPDLPEDAQQPEIVADDNEGYEGAIVLKPLSGIYMDDEPVAALDFSSLYPSSIISENLSHDSVVWVKDYDLKGNFVQLKEGSDTYDNLPNWDYLEVDYDILRPDPTDTRKHPRLIPQGRRVCRYAQPKNFKEKSTLPKILMKLLSQRKATRKLAEKETDEFKCALLDAQQLAYKLTANSLYGQLGSNTSKIRRKCIAASTTGHGRQQLLFSKACIEQAYGPAAGDPRCAAIAVYGDTDSVFISFRPKDPTTGERLTGRAAQEAAKALAVEAGQKISGALKPPHDFEFDKMFRCFCLLSKKRYVGDMTEGGLEESDYHRKAMGIAIKRRGNAPIVKYVYGGALEHILSKRDIVGAFHFVRQATKELLAGTFSMNRLLITKALRAEYAGAPPAHKVLADRIGKRDPGNKPASNDRIPFIYVAPPKGQKPPALQGDRIETPTFIRENNLKPDYAFYVTNQIAKPVSELFSIVVERLPGFKAQKFALLKQKKKEEADARQELAEELLFGDLVRDAQRDAAGQRDLRSFFGAK